MTTTARADLIILAAPQADDPYYADVADAIFDFQVAFAQAVLAAGDDVIVLADKTLAQDYEARLGARHVARHPLDDIWARDFSPSHASSPVLFRYTAAGQGGGRRGQQDADAVQDSLTDMLEAAGITIPKTNLLNDGGNFVEDGLGNLVVSRKFLADNNLTEDQARRRLQAFDRIRQVAFIDADEQGGLEHADGVVSFIDEGVLAINAYPDDPVYSAKLKADLMQGLDGVTLLELPAPYDGRRIYDDRFGSACGLYTNALVTKDRIYLPQFGLKEDEAARKLVAAHTTKQVVPIRSDAVCHMGGGVRCLSWQMRGIHADRLRAYLVPE